MKPYFYKYNNIISIDQAKFVALSVTPSQYYEQKLNNRQRSNSKI